MVRSDPAPPERNDGPSFVSVSPLANRKVQEASSMEPKTYTRLRPMCLAAYIAVSA